MIRLFALFLLLHPFCSLLRRVGPLKDLALGSKYLVAIR